MPPPRAPLRAPPHSSAASCPTGWFACGLRRTAAPAVCPELRSRAALGRIISRCVSAVSVLTPEVAGLPLPVLTLRAWWEERGAGLSSDVQPPSILCWPCLASSVTTGRLGHRGPAAAKCGVAWFPRATVSPGGLQADGAWRPDGRPRHKACIARKSMHTNRQERAEHGLKVGGLGGREGVFLGHSVAVLTPDGSGHTEPRVSQASLSRAPESG